MTKWWAFAAASVLVPLLGCSPPAPPMTGDTQRVVSLAPHLTELMYTAGAGDLLVGVVEYSDFPDAARELPRIGDAFRVDHEALAVLRPDLVLAWEGGNPAALIDELRKRGYRVEAMRTGALANIASNLKRVGELTGRPAQADAAAKQFLDGLASLRGRYADVNRVRVFFQIDRQPLYTVSGEHAIGQILSLCGGDNIFADLPALAASVAVESVVAADPQVLMTTGDVSALSGWQRFDTLAAIRNAHVYGVTADSIARDSVRILDGAREVCGLLDRARTAPAAQASP